MRNAHRRTSTESFTDTPRADSPHSNAAPHQVAALAPPRADVAHQDIGEFELSSANVALDNAGAVAPGDVRHADEAPARYPDEAPACATFYVALMARHEEQMRREMRARMEKRSAASRIAWTVAIVVAVLFALVTSAAARPMTNGDLTGDRNRNSDRDRDHDIGRSRNSDHTRNSNSDRTRNSNSIGDRNGNSISDRNGSRRPHINARRVAEVASRNNDRERDDGDDGDDNDNDDERDDRGGVAIELEVDGSSGATAAGGPTTGRAPAIAEVLEAAYDAAGLNRDPTRSWIRRARVAGLIPWVSVKTGWDQSWHDDEPGDVGRSRTFEVRATWRLDRLLFDGRELQMSTIDTARRRERRRLASRVIRAYFVWRKVVGRGGLAAEAAVAELDALTDGWFSERAKSGR